MDNFNLWSKDVDEAISEAARQKVASSLELILRSPLSIAPSESGLLVGYGYVYGMSDYPTMPRIFVAPLSGYLSMSIKNSGTPAVSYQSSTDVRGYTRIVLGSDLVVDLHKLPVNNPPATLSYFELKRKNR